MYRRIASFFTRSAPEPEHAFIRGVSHINIGVPDLEEAIRFYRKLLGAKPVRVFPRFRNRGFARSAGFLAKPEEVEVSIAFLDVPGTWLTLELMQYHAPEASDRQPRLLVNDIAGVRHVALRVVKIDEAFAHVASLPGVRFINEDKAYAPFTIDTIRPDEFRFYDPTEERDLQKKQEVCAVVGGIRYFYFIDPYGVQWEFEQGNDGIGH